MQEQSNPPPHWVPECYLHAWAVPQCATQRRPHVWRIDRATRRATLLPVDELLPPNDARDAGFQRMLRRMEALLTPTMREVIAPMRPLGPQDRAFLAFFAAAMLARTPEQRDDWQGEWQQILEQMQRKERISKTLYSPALVQGWATVMSGDSSNFAMERGEALATPSVHGLLAPTMRGIGRILSRMSVSVLTSDSQQFITSDAPCVMFDRAAGTVELGSPSTQVQLPLAPNQLLNFSWRREVDGRYIPVVERVVDEANRTTQLHAHEWLVAAKDETQDIWFDMAPPGGQG